MKHDRDMDLNDLEKELGAPYIHKPDQLNVTEGALCWLDQTRVCGSSCMAYNVEDSDEEGNLLQGHEKCVVLYNLVAQGSAAQVAIAANLATIARAQSEVQQEMRQAQDAQRIAAGGGQYPKPPKV